jgi:hypothetical protein
MEGNTMPIGLEIGSEDGVLRGSARAGEGPAREFSGWLGLLGTIDALLGEQDLTEEDHE